MTATEVGLLMLLGSLLAFVVGAILIFCVGVVVEACIVKHAQVEHQRETGRLPR